MNKFIQNVQDSRYSNDQWTKLGLMVSVDGILARFYHVILGKAQTTFRKFQTFGKLDTTEILNRYPSIP